MSVSTVEPAPAVAPVAADSSRSTSGTAGWSWSSANSDIAANTSPETSGSVEFSNRASVGATRPPTGSLARIGKGVANGLLAGMGAGEPAATGVVAGAASVVDDGGASLVVVEVGVAATDVLVVDDGGAVVVDDGGAVVDEDGKDVEVCGVVVVVVVDVVEVVAVVVVVVVASGMLAAICTLSK